jgi:glycosyltransferase involved in cell wall biosynthesis
MKVSVLVVTYNHAPFIRQCLDSVLMQRLETEYEILISEDCSTDGTRELVKGYQQRHPEIIRLILSDQNVRTNAVVARGIQAARGDYVALLDGDDYWIAPDKLQRQAAFLDNHPECTLCFHNAQVLHEDGTRGPWNWTPPGHPEITSIEDLFLGNYIATCSTMFRKGTVDPIPAWYDLFFPITDWPLHLLNAEHGLIGYINEVMGVYRYHPGGLYSPLSEDQKLSATLDFYQHINSSMEGRHHRLVQVAISTYFIEWAEEYLKRGQKDRARRCFATCLKGRPLNKYVSPRRLLLAGLRSFLPNPLLMRPLRNAFRAAPRAQQSASPSRPAPAKPRGSSTRIP